MRNATSLLAAVALCAASPVFGSVACAEAEPDGGPPTEPVAPADKEPVEPAAPTITARSAALARSLDQAFEDQPLGSEWARSKEDEIERFFAETPQTRGSTVTAVACRESLCRVRVEHDDPEAADRLMTAAGSTGPLRAAGARFPDPDASASVLYLSREGVGLPRREVR